MKNKSIKTLGCLECLTETMPYLSDKMIEIAKKTTVTLLSEDIDKDLSRSLSEIKEFVYFDLETTGLDFEKDRICKVQIFAPSIERLFLIDILPKSPTFHSYENLGFFLSSPVPKVFHYALTDCAFINFHFRTEITNVYCTYLANSIIKNSGQNSFADVCLHLLGVKIDKKHQRSYWGEMFSEMPKDKLEYMVSDVFFLKFIKDRIDKISVYEAKCEIIAKASSLVTRIARLRTLGFDIFKICKD